MKYNIGDKIFIKDILGKKISKSIEGIAYTKDNIYYITDAIGLSILGYEENDIILDERENIKQNIVNSVDNLSDKIFDKKIYQYMLESDNLKI